VVERSIADYFFGWQRRRSPSPEYNANYQTPRSHEI
jgi:hypothetical protein